MNRFEFVSDEMTRVKEKGGATTKASVPKMRVVVSPVLIHPLTGVVCYMTASRPRVSIHQTNANQRA